MANFTPVLGDYTELKPFRFWCQKVLPLVYDDSLSYYELLCKVVDYLNKTMEDVDTLHTDVENLHTAYEQLQEYVNDYFDNLDVQEEINNKLDDMAKDGSLSALISPFIPDIVTDWLNKHVEPTSPVIDNTLTISGAGADSKTVGDKFNDVKIGFNDYTEIGIYNYSTFKDGYYVSNSTGEFLPLNTYCISPYIETPKNTTIYISGCDEGSQCAFYDENKNYISGLAHLTDGELTIDIDNVKYTVMCTTIANKDKILVANISESIRQKYMESRVYNLNLIDNSTWNDGFYVMWTDGVIRTVSGFSLTPFMPISNNDIIKIEGTSNGSQLAFYDEDYVYVSGATTYTDMYLKVPEGNNIKYFRWCTPTDNKNNASIKLCNLLFSTLLSKYHVLFNENLITPENMLNGYYVNWTTGAITNLSTYCVTDYIMTMPNAIIKFDNYSAGSQLAYYDENFDYVGGERSTKNIITVPNNVNIKYFRWCCEIVDKNNAKITQIGLDSTYNKNYVIDSTVGLLKGLMFAYENNYKKVFVDAGNYDIINEYLDRFGDSYFSNYTSNYNGSQNGNWDRGLWIDDIDVTFSSDANVVANYTGDNINVKQYFSAFAIGSDAKISGLNLVATNLRYAVHPDFHPRDNETIIFENCNIEGVNTYGGNGSRAIGAGLGLYSTCIFKNCVFKATTNDAVISIHNNYSNNAKSNVTIEGCYVEGNGYFRIAYYGSSEKITPVKIHNCSYVVTPEFEPENATAQIINMKIISWNNELRD